MTNNPRVQRSKIDQNDECVNGNLLLPGKTQNKMQKRVSSPGSSCTRVWCAVKLILRRSGARTLLFESLCVLTEKYQGIARPPAYRVLDSPSQQPVKMLPPFGTPKMLFMMKKAPTGHLWTDPINKNRRYRIGGGLFNKIRLQF